MNRSQEAQDTAYAKQRTERAHRLTGAMGSRTPHTQNNTPSGHTGEHEPGGPGHRTRNTTHRAGTPVNRSQGAQDIAHATQHTERAHRWTGARRPRTPHTQHNTTSGNTGEQESGGPAHRTHVGRPGDRKEPTPHGSDTLGRPSRPTGPVAGAVLQGCWSEPGQAASGTMANVTRSHGSNR